MFTQMPNFAEGGFEFLRKLWGGGFAGMAGGGMPNMASFAAPPMDLEEIDKRKAQIRDIIIMVLSSKTYEEVSSSSGKDSLRGEIRDTINSFLVQGKISNVFFTDFIYN